MNIVKGVANLIRRNSISQSGGYGSAPQSGRFSPPIPAICFSEIGDEAGLKALWERCMNTVDEVEKRKVFSMFLEQFLNIFQNWKPINQEVSFEESFSSSPVNYSQNSGDVFVGCYFGHPTEVIIILSEEIAQIATLLINNQVGVSTSINFTREALLVLDALRIVTLSDHNCKAFGYYGGIQKLSALMKAAVVQLKTITNALSSDEYLAAVVENAGVFQKILVQVVSIICNFIDLNPRIEEKVQNKTTMGGSSPTEVGGILGNTYDGVSSPAYGMILSWHQTAVVSVMEAGGLNWLLEILRVIWRLNMKEQLVDFSLQYLTLRALQSALVDNPRGQNHFRSIGGLEVLLDGLGLPCVDSLIAYDSSMYDERNKNALLQVFDLHVLSLEVLREAVFGNFNNLRFLCENGRVHKFANSFCSLAFMLQEYKRSNYVDDTLKEFDMKETIILKACQLEMSSSGSYLQHWIDYVARLIAALSCFLLEAKEAQCYYAHSASSTHKVVSAIYAELSVKWFTRVLVTVFPCIKACSDQNEMPEHLRVFVFTMQQCVLSTFKKVLISSPSLIDVFRAEGVWDFVFSESFFYFGSATAECSGENCSRTGVPFVDVGRDCGSIFCKDRLKRNEFEIFQVEVISFLEFAATLSGSSNNLPECTVLLDALDQSACNPVLVLVLAKSLLHVLQISGEKTVYSFKALAAIPRMLKIACIQVQESKRSGDANLDAESTNKGITSYENHEISCVSDRTHNWGRCMELFMEIFAGYYSVSDDAKASILQSSACISFMFDLFWEDGLRSHMLKYALDLMRTVPLSDEDHKAKLFLCSKYLETFTHLKERVKNFTDLSIELMVGIRDMIQEDPLYYQTLLRESGCFLHVVSLLNGYLDAENREKLVLNVIQTLTCLLSSNDASKAALRTLVGKGYQTLQSLLLDFNQWESNEVLLSELLDMLVDGKFDLEVGPIIKNEDAVLLYLTVLQRSGDPLQRHGLDMLFHLLRDSLSNRASCARAGMLDFLLNWFSQENRKSMLWQVAQLIQVMGGYSISGKDIRKIFTMIRSTRSHKHSLLLTSMSKMLDDKGPIAFFDHNGIDSGIVIKTQLRWPLNKGFSFTCWLRVENFPKKGLMGLFSFLTENGRGCYALIAKDKLIYESISQKRQCVHIDLNLVSKKWHFFCLIHSIGRAFSGGSQLKCYLDGILVSSQKCRYVKINEPMTSCRIGTPVDLSVYEEVDVTVNDSYPFIGQIGPTYWLSDALSSEHVLSICALGPSYMYYFLDNEISVYVNNSSGGIREARDGLASQIIFGINAQACNGRMLFNVTPMVDHMLDKKCLDATVLSGTQLCSRRLLQQIIYCVGGVSVFFPLLTHSDVLHGNDINDLAEEAAVVQIPEEHSIAETIKLIASMLDENLANQQQMQLLSGFSIMGFLLQSVPPICRNLEILSALKHLFNVVANGGLSELLLNDVISHIFLNPSIWVQTVYNVQRELYMFLIQQFDSDPRFLQSGCGLPLVLDIIRQFYCEEAEFNPTSRDKQITRVMREKTAVNKLNTEEMLKIRLLLLSLGEMSLREHIAVSDVRALAAFFETCQGMMCIEETLSMIIRVVSQKQLLASFVEHMRIIDGCHIFVNLLSRDYEPVRLLGLQFIGRLLASLPSEKKGSKFFSLSVGKSKTVTEGYKKINLPMQPIYSSMSDRLFMFPQTQSLCATLFDVLLGGASLKQVLRQHNEVDRHKNSKVNCQFFLPQILSMIFRFLSICPDPASRVKIIGDLLDLLDSNPSNIEALMENAWGSWLAASVKLDVIKTDKVKMQTDKVPEMDEKRLVRNVYSIVLCHYMLSVKGGWQYVEETANFLILQTEQDGISYESFLRDVYEELIQNLVNLSSEDNIFASQPCRDNTLYLIKLVDEMLISEMDCWQLLPTSGFEFPQNFELEKFTEFNSALFEALQGEPCECLSRAPTQHRKKVDENFAYDWWNIYDKLWIIVSEMNGKGPSKSLWRSSSYIVPSLSQRARGLVESLNIPAAEMAAVVSEGISSALVGKANRAVDKTMLLRGEGCTRFTFHLMVLYLSRSSLERASRCVQQMICMLPFLLTAGDEQSKNRLQLLIWALLVVRQHCGMLDDGARFHVISSLMRETINSGKSILATNVMCSDNLSDLGSTSEDRSTIFNVIQQDRLLSVIADEVKYIKSVRNGRIQQLDELRNRIQQNFIMDSNQNKDFEDQIQSSLKNILASDDCRRSLSQLSLDEEEQIVSERWMHTFHSLFDERGPWSANPFPNCIFRHWKLDKTEDAWRRRQKLRRNYRFNHKLCHPSMISSNDGTLSTSDTKMCFEHPASHKMKQFLLEGIHRIANECLSETTHDTQHLLIMSEIKNSPVRKSNEGTESVDKEIAQDKNESFSRAESENSEVLLSVPCVLVTPKRKLAGHLEIMKKFLHFCGEYLLEGTGGSAVLKTIFSSGKIDPTKHARFGDKEEELPKGPRLVNLTSEIDFNGNMSAEHRKNIQKKRGSIKRHRWWNISKIKAVYWTRYLLRYTAIEIFFGDAVAPIFFNFASQKEAKDVGSFIVATRNESLFGKGYKEKTGTISFVDRRLAQEMAESARQSWRRREITNFEYLMILNTLSGRSYNDLTQYPVFPWILADYSSVDLDFQKSSTFRDLSKPIGALDPRRFEVFEERYRNFNDPDIPSFHYGSHYSSMGIVLFYLLRLEPFTAMHRSLQGGKFDHADRLFQSIEGTYKNCLSNTSDVKELIPEFFYMPEFLINSNSYHFGLKQDGEPIGDVCLPPWAKDSPEEFIRRNREALESEYVSSNLHHWIDLIFGYKQRGKPAIEAANVFYYLTYEGAVDLDNMEDELQRSAIEDQIANFGQTPIQIFQKKHPRRGPPIPIAHPLRFAPDSINLTSVIACPNNSPSAVVYVSVFDSYIVLVSKNLTVSVKMWLTTQLQSGGNFTFSSSQDPFFGIGSDVLSPCKLWSSLADNFEVGAGCFATLQAPTENFLITCGNWDNSFQLMSLSDGRIVQTVRHHKDVVSCIAVTADGSFLATGSYDTTVMVWEILHSRASERRSRNSKAELSWKDYAIADSPFHILCAHDDIVTCLFVSAELDLVISGSEDGTCVLHTLWNGRYVRSIRHPCSSPLSKLVASRHGQIVLYAYDDLSLHLYSINGRHIATVESNGRLSCLQLSSCDEYLFCAGDQGQIVVRSMNSLEILGIYAGIGKVVSSLKITPEECFIAGTKDGDILVYSIENPKLHKISLQINSKS